MLQQMDGRMDEVRFISVVCPNRVAVKPWRQKKKSTTLVKVAEVPVTVTS